MKKLILVPFVSALLLVGCATDAGFWKDSSSFWQKEHKAQGQLLERALTAGERCVTMLEAERGR